MTRAGRLVAAVLAAVVASGCAAVAGPEPPTAGPPSPAPATAVASSSTSAVATPAATAGATTSAAAPSSAGTASAEASAPALRVTTALNFRDLAGSGLEIAGGRMATGAVYRSGKLANLSRADRTRLARAGISDIIDLRTPAVAKRSPDPAIKGATYNLVNIFAVYSRPTPKLRTVAAAKEFMRGTYSGFVTVAAQRRQVGKALELIAAADGPVIIHCTEGKDRTGWLSALLQLHAGADVDSVVSEYLKSNDYRAGVINRSYRTTLKQRGATAAKVQRALLKVEASYLQAGLLEIEHSYGGLDAYLREGLGLSQETLGQLRKRFSP